MAKAPLVGRDAELAIVRRLVASTAAGAGGVLLVRGEAGIGKSRLLAAASDGAAGAGLSVLTGRAVEGNGSYRAVAQALAGLSVPNEIPPELRPFRAALGRVLPIWFVPDIEPAVDPALLLGEGLLRLLDGSLLVLEDLHWADAETIALVTYLADAARTHRLLVAAASRDDERTPAFPPSASMTVVALRRLQPDDATFLATVLGELAPPVVQSVVAAADGLPLVIEELVADGRSAPTFAAIVRARTDRLTRTQRAILGAAALLGSDPDWTRLTGITGHPEAVVLEALHAAHGPLLVADPARPDQLTWRHGLIREAVLAELTGPQRSAYAGRAATALMADPATAGLAAELFIRAGQRSRGTALLLDLARRDLTRGALHSADAYLERARATATDGTEPAPLGGTGPPDVAAERVRLLVLLGRAQEALDLGAGLVSVFTGDAHAELCLYLAEAAVATRRWSEAERYLERAGRLNDPDNPRAMVIAADAAFGPGDLDRAVRLADAVIAAGRVRSPVHVPSLIHAYVIRARCATRTDPGRGRHLYAKAAQLAAEHGLAPQRVNALIGLATIDLNESTPSAALAEAREIALDTGQLGQVVWIDQLTADETIVTAGPAAAEPAARRAAELAGRLRLPGLQAVGEAYLALCRVAGDPAGARTLLDQAVQRPSAPIEVAAAAHLVEAMRHLLAHDLGRAAATLDAGMRPLLGRDETAPLFAWGLWALLSAVAGDPSTVDVVRAAPAAFRAANRAAVGYADAVLAGDPSLAAQRFAAADRVLPESSWWRRLLRLVALEAAVDGGWGDPVPALRVDLEAFVAGGDDQLARTARDLLRRAGAPTRRGRGQSAVPAHLRAAGVTSREMDVLRLVAEGLTNREIAGRLFLSPRTVETHVANLLSKTGVATRGGLGAVTR